MLGISELHPAPANLAVAVVHDRVLHVRVGRTDSSSSAKTRGTPHHRHLAVRPTHASQGLLRALFKYTWLDRASNFTLTMRSVSLPAPEPRRSGSAMWAGCPLAWTGLLGAPHTAARRVFVQA